MSLSRVQRGRLKMSNTGHIGFVGRQPAQCKCLLCRQYMVVRGTEGDCKVAKSDLRPLMQFVATTRNWKSEACKIRDAGNPKTETEQAVYRVVNALGPSGVEDMKLTADVAADVLAYMSGRTAASEY